MSLKIKTLLILLTFTGLYIAIHGVILRTVILPKFYTLELNEAEKNIHRPVMAFDRELYHLSVFVHDWSTWDDTYNFMKTGSLDYVKSNLEPVDSFTLNNLGHLVGRSFCAFVVQNKSVIDIRIVSVADGHHIIAKAF